MAESGSACATAVNALAASIYQNECRRATARSKGFCTETAHDVSKVTWPIRSPVVWARGVATQTAIMKAAIVATVARAVRRFIGAFLPRASVSQRIGAQLEMHDQRAG